METHTPISFISIIAALISLFGLFFVVTFSHSWRRLAKRERDKALNKSRSFYFGLHNYLFGNVSTESVLFSASSCQQILRAVFVITYFSIFIDSSGRNLIIPSAQGESWQVTTLIFFIVSLLLSLILVGDIIPKCWAFYGTKSAFTVATPIASLFLAVTSPVNWLFYKLIRIFSPSMSLSPYKETLLSSKDKDTFMEMVSQTDSDELLSEHDRKLLLSVLNFRERIAREVMVPRVDLFCIPHDMSIKEAALLLEREGYSRVPIYKNTQDQIVGVLMYKDVLKRFMDFEKSKDESLITEPVMEIAKGVLYSPETKKISQLLQDFRKKRSHIAVVVDEYGGTSGIVTIEDILEEIVGEIADEYDEAEQLFEPFHKGSWIIDGRMNLLDLEEELNIRIPQEGDYDTIAGYVIYRLGTIPQKGVVIEHDDFNLEILECGERSIEKVRITPKGANSLIPGKNLRQKTEQNELIKGE